jgi:3-hydroxyacyl-CoA dehydrogenase
MKIGGFITAYEAYIAEKIAYVLTGGNAAPGMLVSEQYLLDIEREAFMSLIREQKTQERIQALITTGKRIRN